MRGAHSDPILLLVDRYQGIKARASIATGVTGNETRTMPLR